MLGSWGTVGVGIWADVVVLVVVVELVVGLAVGSEGFLRGTNKWSNMNESALQS